LAYYYDFLLGEGGHAIATFLGANYVGQNLDACREMLADPCTVSGLSDGGAHVDFLCDTSNPTVQLVHWGRDRTRGPRLAVELLVKKSTLALAELYGLHDRGLVAVGKRADLNVIDFDHLSIGRPELRHDLPAGGRRFLQPAHGYIATFVAGAQVRSNDEDTGARPGRLARPRR
jgi:N-acyl-D-aspartate/D-glutamate deacylase